MWWKKAARSCQSLSFRNVIIAGSKKSLLSLHTTTHYFRIALHLMFDERSELVALAGNLGVGGS